MDSLDRIISMLLEAIRHTDTYIEYKIQEAKLEKDPELKKRVDAFRAENFRSFGMGSAGDFEASEALSKDNAELRKDPRVNAYLDAELALCRLIQRITKQITDGIDIHIPEY